MTFMPLPCGDPDLQQLIDRQPIRKNPTHASLLPILEDLLNERDLDSVETTRQGGTT